MNKAIFAALAVTSAAHATPAIRQTYDIPGSERATAIDIVTGKAGDAYCICAYTRFGESFLRSYSYDGTRWQPDGEIAASQTADAIQGADLEIDDSGNLHVSFYQDADVRYATRPAGGSSWTTDDVTTGAAPSLAGSRRRYLTSITITGPTRHIVYNRQSGDTADDVTTVYATRANSGAWSTEDVLPGGSISPIAGETLVLRDGRIPRNGFFLGSRGPVLGYADGGNYYLIERFRPLNIGGGLGPERWSTPLAIGQIVPAGGAGKPTRLDLAFDGPVLHALFHGREDGQATEGLHYYRREVVSGAAIPVVSTRYTDVAGRVSLARIAVGSDGIAQALYKAGFRSDGATAFSIATDRQDRFETCAEPFIEDYGTLGGIFPAKDNAFALDVFGRAFAGVTRTRNDTGDLPAQIVYETGIPYSAEEVVPATTLGSTFAVASLPGGGSMVVFNRGSGRIGTAYRGTRTDLQLNFFQPGEEFRTVENIQAVAIGGETVIALVETSWRGAGVLSETGRRSHVVTFVSGAFRSSRVFTSTTTVAGGLPGNTDFTIARSGDTAEIHAITTAGLIGGGPAPFPMRTVETLERPLMSVSTTMGTGFFRPRSSANGADYAVVGTLENQLRVHVGSAIAIDFDALVADANPAAFDVAVGTGFAYVAFTEGDDVRLARASRGSDTPITSRRILRDAAASQVWLDLAPGGGLQLAVRSGDTVTLYSYESAPFGEEDPEPTSASAIASGADRRASLSFGEDAFPAVAYRPGNGLPIAVSTSPLAEDADGDGLPTFAELALCRDPMVSDGSPVLGVSRAVSLQNGSAASNLVFERPALPATVEDGVIRCGAFSYQVETSFELETWFPPFDRLDLRTEPFSGAAVPTGLGSNGGFLQPVSVSQQISSPVDVYREQFHRLRIGVR